MGRRRVVLSIVWWSHPSPPLLDSGLRRNDEWGAGLTKGCRVDVGGGIAVDVLSRNVSSWIPAFAGMTNVGVR